MTDLYIICLFSIPTFSAFLAINSPPSHDTAYPQIPCISTHRRYPKESAGEVYKSFPRCPNFKKNMGMDTDMDKKKPQRNHVLQRAVISQAQISSLPRDPVLTAEHATPISLAAKRHFTKP